MEVSDNNKGYPVRGPHNQDYSILVSILGSPIQGNDHIQLKLPLYPIQHRTVLLPLLPLATSRDGRAGHVAVAPEPFWQRGIRV